MIDTPARPNRYAQAAQLAEDAIALFVEFRDVHGYDEDRARRAVVTEVIESLAVDTFEIDRELREMARSQKTVAKDLPF